MLILDLNKRVAMFVAALFIFLSSQVAFAGKSETYRDLIKKAQTLLLQQDRLQALQILSDGIRKEPAKSAGRKELIKASAKFGSMFLTDDGQKMFELGRSLRTADAPQGIEKLQEALKKEPGNLVVSIELTRAQLRANECSRAKKSIEGYKELYPSQAAVVLLLKQVSTCLNEAPIEEADQISVFEKGSKELTIYQYSEAAYKFKNAQFDEEQSKAYYAYLKKQSALDPAYPEQFYLVFKMELKLGLPGLESAKRYAALCKQRPNVDPYAELDPILCSKSEEISSYLAKIGIEQ